MQQPLLLVGERQRLGVELGEDVLQGVIGATRATRDDSEGLRGVVAREHRLPAPAWPRCQRRRRARVLDQPADQRFGDEGHVARDGDCPAAVGRTQQRGESAERSDVARLVVEHLALDRAILGPSTNEHAAHLHVIEEMAPALQQRLAARSAQEPLRSPAHPAGGSADEDAGQELAFPVSVHGAVWCAA